MMDKETELKRLEELFVGMGSARKSAAVMAGQVSRRATQLAEEHGVSREEAMGYLLNLVAKGRSGESVDSFMGEDSDKTE